jgi:peptidoglycan/LPS O-acetylase OafA/YrhL
LNNRLRELDFLRGIAIILVLLRHIPLSNYTTNLGWIGVDLFFVLSGYLVSGLLFREYIRFGNIQPRLFLIRRGFKIYPVYYLFYIPYLLLLLTSGNTFSARGFFADMTFTQNFLWGWGYAYPASWSLAVEEHFYFGLSILLWVALERKWFGSLNRTGVKSLLGILLIILMVCLTIRISCNIIFETHFTKLFTTTFFRIDSLLMGVLISYLYHFRANYLRKLYQTNHIRLFVIMLLGLCWVPFLDPVPSFHVKSYGFTLLYISFGILLIAFLLTEQINERLDNILSKPVVNVVSKIGFCSYSIYIIHSLVIDLCHSWFKNFESDRNQVLFFVVASTISIVTGMLMTYKVENYFLALRNKHFPSRA